MKKFIVQAILLLVIIGTSLLIFQQSIKLPALPFMPGGTAIQQLEINGAKIKVEVADTQAKRSRGLGGRESLASDEGMLFNFPKEDKYPFWMKGLTFPLDFVWIRGETVVDITENVQPPTPGQTDQSLPIYQSKEAIDKVLEVNAGSVQRLNIKVGDKIRII